MNLRAVGSFLTLLFSLIALVVAGTGCGKPPESVNMLVDRIKSRFEDRSTAIVADRGLPFFTERTLKMVWNDALPIVRVPRLTLLDQEGRKRDLSFFLGQVSVLGFFATNAKGERPQTLKSLKYIEKQIGRNSRVQYVAITVNPVHDMPSKLKSYAESMNLNTKASWALLTGPVETIYGLAKNTFASPVSVSNDKNGAQSFGHSDKIYVIDEEGRLRAIATGTLIEMTIETKKTIKQLMLPPGNKTVKVI